MSRTWTARRVRVFGQECQGFVTLELAMILPAMLIMILGIIEFGWLSWNIEAAQQGAAMTARCMGVLGSACTSGGAYSSTAATTYLQGVVGSRGVTLPSGSATLSNGASCGNNSSGFSKVTVRFPFKAIVANAFNAFNFTTTIDVAACFPNQPLS